MYGIPFFVQKKVSEDYCTTKWEEKTGNDSVPGNSFISQVWETIKNIPYLTSENNITKHLWKVFGLFVPDFSQQAKITPAPPHISEDKLFPEEIHLIEKRAKDPSLLPIVDETKREIYDLTQRSLLIKDRLEIRKEHDRGTLSDKTQIENLEINLLRINSFISEKKKYLHMANVISELRETEKSYLASIKTLSNVLDEVETSISNSANQLTAEQCSYISFLLSKKLKQWNKSLIILRDFSAKLDPLISSSEDRLELVQKKYFEDISKAYNLLNQNSASDQAEYNLAYTNFINFLKKIENKNPKSAYGKVKKCFEKTLPEGKSVQFYASQPFQRGPRLLLLAGEALKKSDETSQIEHMEIWVENARRFNLLVNDLLAEEAPKKQG